MSRKKAASESNSLTLRPAEVAEMIGVSRPTLYRWISSGILPPAKQLGPNSVAWLRSDIEGWLASRPDHNVDREQAA